MDERERTYMLEYVNEMEQRTRQHARWARRWASVSFFFAACSLLFWWLIAA